MSADAAVRRFLLVLDAENRLLGAGDVPGATALLPGKQAAADALRVALKGAGSKVEVPSPGLLAELKARVDENAERLRLALATQARILEMVARASVAGRAGGGTGGYGRRGGRGGAVSSRPGALALALRA